MKPLSFSDAVRLAESRGFTRRRGSGSHQIFRDDTGRRVVIPFHRGDLPTGTARAVLRAIGIDPATWR
ncbi:MAG: type II toxin-antitoxin system HicA family toxin [Kiritimatiellae bacterium]|nr:type II toxin-antitoxin system HicA family toxin [Kiritimatiellia bacterium]